MWKMGNFARVCRNKPKKGKVTHTSHNEATGNENELFVGSIVKGDEETKSIWNQKLRVGNCSIKFKLHTGSDISIISERQHRKM